MGMQEQAKWLREHGKTYPEGTWFALGEDGPAVVTAPSYKELLAKIKELPPEQQGLSVIHPWFVWGPPKREE